MFTSPVAFGNLVRTLFYIRNYQSSSLIKVIIIIITIFIVVKPYLPFQSLTDIFLPCQILEYDH